MKNKKMLFAMLFLAGTVSSYTLYEVMTDIDHTRTPASNSVPENYDTLSGCEKQEILWEKVVASTHKELPAYSKFGAIQLLKMSFQEIGLKGSLHSDFAPKDWIKYIHRRGAIVKTKLVPRSGVYTGIFQGADCGLLRLSLTYNPNGSKAVAPGIAFKILRDGTHSANISALVSLEGQDRDFNFFKNPLSNVVPISSKFGQKLVHNLFGKVTSYPEELEVSDMAMIDAKGEKAKEVKTPRQLFFVPAGPSFSSEDHDVREDFLSIPEGTTVYKLYALSAKYKNFDYSNYKLDDVAKFIQDSEHVADIVTTSEFVASEFGDEGIFFRHQLRP